jgi:signal transduction histidine kinase
MIKILSFVFFSLIFVGQSHATTKDELVAFVNEAKEFALSSGEESALTEFSNVSGKFNRGELYIFAYDYTGTVMAHGAKPALVGKNLLAIKDTNGVELIKDMVDVAKGDGSGYVVYSWEHPSEKKVMRKVGYVTKVSDAYWIGSGIYSND